MLGWVALTFKKIKTAFILHQNEKLCCVIALGYGSTQGHPHKMKAIEKLYVADNPPTCFLEGVKAALLGPSSLHQQKFLFTLIDKNKVHAKAKLAFNSKIDLGIAKYHFEIGAGIENFQWHTGDKHNH